RFHLDRRSRIADSDRTRRLSAGDEGNDCRAGAAEGRIARVNYHVVRRDGLPRLGGLSDFATSLFTIGDAASRVSTDQLIANEDSMPTATRINPLSFLTDQLDELKAKGTHFKLRVLEDEQAPVCTFDGKQVINLASNNYLGFTTHPKLREAALEATRKYGVGSGAVRTIAGTMKIHMELEEKIARFKDVEACVVFQSGFTANAGTVSSFLGKDDYIISDELNHASIIDGCRLSRAKILVLRHKDVAHAEEQLASVKSQPGKKLLITDGVFSMDGDIGPLPGLCEAAEKYGAIMMVDDAHASGVLGRNGRGTVDHFKMHRRVDIQVGTLSKAIG